MSWLEDAACRGTGLPWTRTEYATSGEIALMHRVCSTCPVADACRKDMLARQDLVGFRAGVLWTNPFGDIRRATALSPVRTCAYCGREFARDGKRVYCCRGCAARAAGERQRQRHAS